MRLLLGGSLFHSGEPAIGSVILADARINLIVGHDGRPSWVFGGKEPRHGDAKTPLAVRIANGTLTYLDERSGFAVALDEIEADTTLSGPDGEFTAKGGVVLNKQPVSFTLFLKSPRRIAEDGSPIDLNFSSPSLMLALSGRLAVAKAFDITGQVTARSDDLRLLAPWFGSKLSGTRGLRNFEIGGKLEATEKT